MLTAIVTGATSMIGAALADELLRNNWTVIGVVRPHSSNVARLPKSPNLKILEIDMAEIASLADKIKSPCEVFYHLAWEGTRGAARDDELLQKSNYAAAMAALRAAKKLGCATFIGVGSQAEYGACENSSREADICKPNTKYGEYKLRACLDGQSLAKQFDINFIWARIFSAYGRNDYSESLIMHCIDKMRKNQELSLSPCTQRWNFTYVKDIAKILVFFGEKRVGSGVYNVANPEIRILRDYVLDLKSILNSKSEIKFGMNSSDRAQLVHICPSVEKLLNVLPSFKFTTFEEGIVDMTKQLGT